MEVTIIGFAEHYFEYWIVLYKYLWSLRLCWFKMLDSKFIVWCILSLKLFVFFDHPLYYRRKIWFMDLTTICTLNWMSLYLTNCLSLILPQLPKTTIVRIILVIVHSFTNLFSLRLFSTRVFTFQTTNEKGTIAYTINSITPNIITNSWIWGTVWTLNKYEIAGMILHANTTTKHREVSDWSIFR